MHFEHSRAGRPRYWWLLMWRHVVWTFPMWPTLSTLTCRMTLTTMCTALVVLVVPVSLGWPQPSSMMATPTLHAPSLNLCRRPTRKFPPGLPVSLLAPPTRQVVEAATAALEAVLASAAVISGNRVVRSAEVVVAEETMGVAMAVVAAVVVVVAMAAVVVVAMVVEDTVEAVGTIKPVLGTD